MRMPDPNLQTPVLTKQEAAAFFRLLDGDETPEQIASACRAVDHLVQTGRLRAVRIGKRNYFYRRELVAFLEREIAAQPVSASTDGGDEDA